MRVIKPTRNEILDQLPNSGFGTSYWPFGYWPHEVVLPNDPYVDLLESTDSGFRVIRVAGVRFHHQTLRENPGSLLPGSPVRFVSEPTNPHDSCAVVAVDSGTGELYGYLPQRLDEDSPGLRASLAGTNGRVLCHWRKVTEGSSSDLPVSAHVLIEDPSMPAVAFPEIEWEVNYDLFWGTSIGPE